MKGRKQLLFLEIPFVFLNFLLLFSCRAIKLLLSQLFQELKHFLSCQMSSAVRRKLEEASRMISNESTDHAKLRECVAVGIGFHHAGSSHLKRKKFSCTKKKINQACHTLKENSSKHLRPGFTNRILFFIWKNSFFIK